MIISWGESPQIAIFVTPAPFYALCNLNCCPFLYAESNERLQVHLKERMHSLEEKNHLSNELERTKKKLEESGESKARTDAHLERLRNELNIKTVMAATAESQVRTCTTEQDSATSCKITDEFLQRYISVN